RRSSASRTQSPPRTSASPSHTPSAGLEKRSGTRREGAQRSALEPGSDVAPRRVFGDPKRSEESVRRGLGPAHPRAEMVIRRGSMAGLHRRYKRRYKRVVGSQVVGGEGG